MIVSFVAAFAGGLAGSMLAARVRLSMFRRKVRHIRSDMPAPGVVLDRVEREQRRRDRPVAKTPVGM